MGTLPKNAVMPPLTLTGCLEFVPWASLISGTFVFIVGFLRNMPKLKGPPWSCSGIRVDADGASLIRTLEDLSACLQEPREPGLAGAIQPRQKGHGHLGPDCWPKSQPSARAAQNRDFLSRRI